MNGWRYVIDIHPAANLIPPMSAEEVRATGKNIRVEDLKHRIVFWRGEETKKESLIDGRSRLDAMEAEGLPIFADGKLIVPHFIRTLNPQGPNDVKRPENETPESYVWSANIHRRHLNAEGKRKAIANALKANPEKSNRQIAKLIGVSHNTVESVRTEMESTGQIDQLTETVGADGKSRPRPTPEDEQESEAAEAKAASGTGSAPTPEQTADDRKRLYETEGEVEEEEEEEEVEEETAEEETETEKESESNGGPKPDGDAKAIIKACLAEVVPALRVAIASMDAKGRLVLLDELRKATSALMREVTTRDADTDRWAETTH